MISHSQHSFQVPTEGAERNAGSGFVSFSFYSIDIIFQQGKFQLYSVRLKGISRVAIIEPVFRSWPTDSLWAGCAAGSPMSDCL